MIRRLLLLLAATSPLLSCSLAPAQTALERLESKLRQQLGKGQTPPPPAPAGADSARPADEKAPAAPGEKKPGGAWLGVVADDEKDRGRGVRVLEITPGGPAAKAGFQLQDLITSVGGIRVRQMTELADMIELYSPGDKITFEVSRSGKMVKLETAMGRRPGQEEAKPALIVPKVEEPLLLGPAVAPSAPLAKPAPPPAAPADDRGRIEALERRLAELEKRLADLERASAPAAKPAK
jgi:membrane-associated protease RseP (regulator of RpoE activity)